MKTTDRGCPEISAAESDREGPSSEINERSRTPIFILGVMPRSGTTFLYHLLLQHPDCGRPHGLGEDFLLFYSQLLDKFTHEVSDRWSGELKRDQHRIGTCLLNHLGSGIVTFLQQQTKAARPVVKTPWVENLEQFFGLFPKARLVILIRDGRAVVESGVRSFGWNREAAMDRWAESARRIENFDERNRGGPNSYLIVRYEELWSDFEATMSRILAFAGLDVPAYDFVAAARTPVLGSSTFGRRGDFALNWKPVPKTEEFDPLSRFKHWSRWRHERFNWVAAEQLAALGYQPKHFEGGESMWRCLNRMMDVPAGFIRLFGPTYLAVLRRIEDMSRHNGLRKTTPVNDVQSEACPSAVRSGMSAAPR